MKNENWVRYGVTRYPPHVIDTHCHLADKQFNADREAVIHRAEEHGVDVMVAIADSLEEGQKCLELAKQYERIFCTIGVHPHVAKHWQEGDTEHLMGMLQSSPKVKAVGEIGLDYHYDNSPRDVQQLVFKEQMLVAKQLDLPAVIHNRDSLVDLKSIIAEVDPPSLVVHCCTEPWEAVADLVERGYFLSFTGIATYPKSDDIRDTIKHCPLEQLMVETDAPYLAPVPHRGKRNEPAYVMEVAKLVAEIKGLSLSEVDEITTKNAVEFFGL